MSKRTGARSIRRWLIIGLTTSATVVAMAAAVDSTGGSLRSEVRRLVASEPALEKQVQEVSRNSVEIVRQTLRSERQFSADLTYGEAREISASSEGVVTWIATVGSTIKPGDPLWRIDNTPTVYLVGELPLYRDLVGGIKAGPDVEQLERLLVELGYGPRGWEPDQRFNSTTTSALKSFEEDHDLNVNGRLTSSEVVIGQYPLRIASAAKVGDIANSGSGLLSATSTEARIVANVTSRQYTWLRDRTAAIVEMPDGTRNQVEYHDAAARADESGEIGYEISFLATELDAPPQPVELIVEETIAEDALVVPVDSLLALVEGGYALEVVTKQGDAELRAVEVLGFDDTSVAVTGSVEVGDLVVVP